MKKTFCVFLLLALLAVGCALAADSGSCGENAFWAYDSGVLTITGTGEMDNWNPGQQPWYQYQESITSVVIDSGITSIGNFAFRGCRLLADVNLPNSLNSMGFEVFSNCTSLTSISLPDQISQINIKSFEGCFNLTDVTLPLNLNRIAGGAFSDCSNLSSITFPENLLRIESLAFSNCTNLTSIILPKSLNYLEGGVFNGCANITSILVADGNETYSSINGLLFSNDGNTLILCPQGKTGSLSVPNCSAIRQFAFSDCSNLTEIVLPESVVTIGQSAFSNCSKLSSITLQRNLAKIENSAFAACNNLTNVYYTKNSSAWNSISIGTGNMALINASIHYGTIGPLSGTCGANVSWNYASNILIINGSGKMDNWTQDQQPWHLCKDYISTVIINPGITNIGDYSFYGHYALMSVTVPESVVEIGKHAFTNTNFEITIHSTNCGCYAYTWARAHSVNGSVEQHCNVVIDNQILPTCLAEGITAGSHCSECGETIIAQERIPALGHLWNDPTYSWNLKTMAVTASHVCDRCNLNEVETVNSESSITSLATCTDFGETTYIVTFVNPAFLPQKKVLRNIEPFGHEWGAPVYQWSEDYSQVTAVRYCLHDTTHVESEIVRAIVSISKSPTCTEEGETTYIGNFSNDAFVSQEKVLSNIDPLGHRWGDPIYQWAEDNSQVTAIRYCLRDENHMETETVNATGAITKEPTCSEKGETTYTGANFANSAFSVQSKATDDVPFYHPLIMHAEIPATYYDDGVAAYWTCEKCGKLFSDSNGEHEISEPVIIGATGVLARGTFGDGFSWLLETNKHLTISGIGDMPDFNDHYQNTGTAPWKDYRYDISSVTVENSITHIGSYSFDGCYYLTAVEIPDNVTSIGPGAFKGCGLKNITLPGGLSAIEENTFFSCDDLESIVIPNGVTSIGSSAFGYCDKLASVIIPNTVTSIGSQAFSKCSSLSEIAIPESVSNIGFHAFSDCTSLSPIIIPEGVTTIEYSTFSGCTNLAHITIPQSVTVIRNSAFSNCKNISSITIPSCSSYAYNWAINQGYGSITQILSHADAIIDEAIAATCESIGLTEGSHCSKCGTTFIKQEVIPALDHDIVIDEAEPATCEETGLTAGTHCQLCGKVLSAQEIVQPLGHAWETPTYDWSSDKSYVTATRICLHDTAHVESETVSSSIISIEPTCVESGKNIYNATFQHEAFEPQTIILDNGIPAKGHTLIVDTRIEPTCTEAGLTEGSYCSVCGEVLSSPTVIPAKGHTVVIDPAIDATYFNPGKTRGSHCSECGIVLVAQEPVYVSYDTIELSPTDLNFPSVLAFYRSDNLAKFIVDSDRNSECITYSDDCVLIPGMYFQYNSKQIIAIDVYRDDEFYNSFLSPIITAPGYFYQNIVLSMPSLEPSIYTLQINVVYLNTDTQIGYYDQDSTIKLDLFVFNPSMREKSLKELNGTFYYFKNGDISANYSDSAGWIIYDNNIYFVVGHKVTTGAGRISGFTFDSEGRLIHGDDMFILPSAMSIVEKEAFSGLGMKAVIIPSSCKKISSKAFANCSNLKEVFFLGNLPDIAPDAFENTPCQLVYNKNP